jgi:hypothetical protein
LPQHFHGGLAAVGLEHLPQQLLELLLLEHLPQLPS